MARIRLGDADRERLGCPEWLEHDPAQLRQVEAEALQDVWGVAPGDYTRWRLGLLGQPEGTPPNPPARALRFGIWQALRRSGVKVDLTELDFDLMDIEIQRDPEPEPGKSPSTPRKTSAAGGGGTRRSSSSSSTSSRGKSTSSTSKSSTR
jgi:hypothetical protein